MQRIGTGVFVVIFTTLALAAACAQDRAVGTEPAASLAPSSTESYAVFRPDLAYLKALIRTGARTDPQLVFLLAAQYLNAGQTRSGIAFFEATLDRPGDALPAARRAVHMAALGLLRAVHTSKLTLFARPAWVSRTVEILEQAKKISDDRSFAVRWAAGIVYARLPGLFGKRKDAIRELEWTEANIDKAPHHGWLREVYFHLALAHKNEGNTDTARALLAKSGYPSFEKAVTLTTPYALDPKTGLVFATKRIREVVPGRVFTVSGYDFTESNFVISRNGAELIAIDAGTKPESVAAAYEALNRHHPNLPALTTVFITHAHWDHIGGHAFFRQLNPDVAIYARDNFAKEVAAAARAPRAFRYFFGTNFSMKQVTSFKPDRLISDARTLTVGGTRVALIPVDGGETEDAMFIHLPELGVLYVGDFIMPYLGAPFLNEGSLDGLFAAIDTATALRPRYILHGHEPLTRLYDSSSVLSEMKQHLKWLKDETLNQLGRENANRAALHHLNLMPPGIGKSPKLQIPYLVMRENVINRLYDQFAGYWQTDLGGLDHLSAGEYGALLSRYLGITERRVTEAVAEMTERGDYELSARVIGWAETQYPNSAEIAALKTKTFRKLRERYQETNPFKFIIYSEVIGEGLKAIAVEPAD